MAITKPPRRNLPGAAEPWGRYVDNYLRQAQVDIEALQRDLTSGLRAVNSSMNRIVAQQSALESQQSDLAAQQAQIFNLLESQTVVKSNSSRNSPTSTTNTGWGNKATTSFTFPSWVNQAIIVGSASIRNRVNMSGEGDDSQLYLRVDINDGTTGGDVTGYPIAEGGGIYGTSLSTTYSALVPFTGSNITVRCQARSSRSVWYPSYSANWAEISAVAIGIR